MGTRHLIHHTDFSQARVVCFADVDASTSIKAFTRLETGDARWTGISDSTQELGACYISDATEDSILSALSALSETSAPNLTQVIFHPSLINWAGVVRLRKFFENDSRNVVSLVTRNRNDFESHLRRQIVIHRLDYEYQLKSALEPEVGSIDISSWKHQFSAAGASEFPRKILPCVRSLAVSEIVHRLRFHKLDKASHFAVLSNCGSDLTLRRNWQSVHGNSPVLKEISEAIQQARNDESILVFVDAIHSGAQLISFIGPIKQDIQQKNLKIVVRSAFTTRFGIRRVLEKLAPDVLINFDTESSLVLENENPATGIKQSELELRLIDFAIEDCATKSVVSFCRKIGAELKALEDQEQPDFNIGLGGFGLGLTTLLAGRPSKGLLPIIRLSGQVTNPNTGRKIDWKALIRHNNMSGAG